VLLATLLRELFTAEQFDRSPESALVTSSEEAVSAFARAAAPNGILSGVYAFFVRQACNMIRRGDRVLDLGCGPASLLAAVADWNRDSTFVGVDRSAGMIATGNDVLRARAARNVELRLDDMTELSSVESGSIDVVLSSMALHHLPDTDHLRSCFDAVERVMAPEAKMFVLDFGRLKSLRSVEYFVRRAIPRDEPILEHDYRASLRAAFSREEFAGALPGSMKQRISIYSTVVSPMMVVLMAPFPESPRDESGHAGRFLERLPHNRRADYWQLCVSLRLGGMPIR
jgi:ubiquinone/menaquinone biosynthesis C-methylase UbiE